MHRRARRAAFAQVALVAFGWTGLAEGQALPPIECLDALRKARVEESTGEGARARQRIEAAVGIRGCELPALAELLWLLRGGAFPESEAAAVRQRLAERLKDPAATVPAGTLTYLASQPGTAEQKAELLAALEGRVAAIEARQPPPAAAELIELFTVASELQERAKKLAEARASVARLIALEGAERWRWRALELDRQLERWDDVARTLEQMLEAPAAPELLRFSYVHALARLGRLDEMTRQIDRITAAGEVEEQNREMLVGLLVETGWLLRDGGNDEQAETLFRRALAIDAASESARAVLLHLYGSGAERAEHAAAVAERRKAEEDPQRLFEEGSQLASSGDLAGAVDLLARAAPALGGTVYEEPGWYNLGLVAYKLERWQEAADAFVRAARLKPDRAETQFQLGVAFYRLERWSDALGPLSSALALKPDKYEAHYFLSACFEKTGDAAAAAREIALYRAAKPKG